MDIHSTITSRNAAAAALGVYFGKVEDIPSTYDDLRSERTTLALLNELDGLRGAVLVATNHLVRAAREEGASWQDIATALVITKQTAHERWRHVDV